MESQEINCFFMWCLFNLRTICSHGCTLWSLQRVKGMQSIRRVQNILHFRKTPQVVRLGDLNLIATDDGANPVDYNVSKFIKHPQYNPRTKKNDIALIELKENVRVDSFIRPACLYQEENNPVEVIAVRS